jgi:hypothetical protein
MPQKIDKHLIDELKEKVKTKNPNDPVEKTLAMFCSKTGLSLETCNIYYNQLVKDGTIKETKP